MPDQTDAERHNFGTEDIRIAATEDGPEVEGHIRRSHAARETFEPEVRVAHNEDEADEDGPDVEGHIFRA